MANHANTTPTTNPPSVTPVTPRRTLFGSLAALAALPALATVAGHDTGDPKRIATIEDYAAIEWEALSADSVNDLGTREAWMEEAAEHWVVLRLAVAALTCDPVQTAQRAGTDVEMFAEFAANMGDHAERFRNLASLLEVTSLRVMAGLARHVVNTQEGTA